MSASSAPIGEKTSAPAVPPPADITVEKKIPSSDSGVTSQASAAESVLSQEEKIEYRDQNGNLLNEEQVKALEGKVSFSTRYETRTRVVDAQGRELADGPAGAEGFGPPHPDVDREPETMSNGSESSGRDSPATASPEEDLLREKSVEKANVGTPCPASERHEATK